EPAELGVACQVNHPHAPATEDGQNLIGADRVQLARLAREQSLRAQGALTQPSDQFGGVGRAACGCPLANGSEELVLAVHPLQRPRAVGTAGHVIFERSGLIPRELAEDEPAQILVSWAGGGVSHACLYS